MDHGSAMNTHPSRIVCLSAETAETLCLLDEGDRIVGLSGPVSHLPEAQQRKPRLSIQTDTCAERICALEPELVLGSGQKHGAVLAALAQRGIAVHLFNQCSVRSILSMIRIVGALVGRDHAAASYAASLEWRIEPESGPDYKSTSNPMRVILVPVPSTKSQAKDPEISILREQTAPYAHTSWTVRIPISNAPKTATVGPAERIKEAGGKAKYDGGVVTLEIPKSAITKWPAKLTLSADGQDIDLPDARALLLPKTLTVRALGRTQFALTGDKAGAIDAVALLRGSKATTIVAATGANVATFDFNDAVTGKKNAAVEEGTYTILPLLKLPRDKGADAFAPLEVVGADDKPLSLVVVKETEERPEEPGRRVTRIVQTIERSEKGSASSNPPPATPSKTNTTNTGVIKKTALP